MLWVEVDVEGLRLVKDRIEDTTFRAILGVELEVTDNITEQDTRAEDLHLIVDTRGVGQEAQVLDVGQHLRSITLAVLVLDEHTSRDLVDGLGVT